MAGSKNPKPPPPPLTHFSPTMKRYTSVDDIPTPPIRPTTIRGPTFDGLWKASLKNFQNEKNISSHSNSVASLVSGADEKPLYDGSKGQLLHSAPNKKQENENPLIGIGRGTTKPFRYTSNESEVSVYIDCEDGFGGVILQDPFNNSLIATENEAESLSTSKEGSRKSCLSMNVHVLERPSSLTESAEDGYFLRQASLFRNEDEATHPVTNDSNEKGLRPDHLEAYRFYESHKPVSHNHRNTGDASEELTKLVSSGEFRRTRSIESDYPGSNVTIRGSTIDEGPIVRICTASSTLRANREASSGIGPVRQSTSSFACAGSFPSSPSATPILASVLPVVTTPTKMVRFQLPEDHIDSSTEDEAVSENSNEHDYDSFTMWLLRFVWNLFVGHFIFGDLLTQVVIVAVAAIIFCWLKGLLVW